MPDNAGTTQRRKHRLGSFTAAAGGIVCLVLIGGYLLLNIFLRTPAASRQAERLLTNYLHTPVKIAGLHFAGGTFTVSGLAISSPAGFPEGYLASSRIIAITPGWQALVHGGKSLSEIAVEGLRITLDKNGKGEWNFTELMRLLSRGKGGGETFIKRLAITDSSLAVEGLLLGNLDLTVTDLSTKGTTASRLILTGKDAGGTPVRLEGGGRLGTTPSLNLFVSASAVPLKNYGKFVHNWPGIDLARGTGALSLGLKLHDGKVAAQGKLGIDHVALIAGKGTMPLKAELEFAGAYALHSDEATLDSCFLRINESIRVHATGRVQQARQSREFTAEVSLADMDLLDLLAMLPTALRGDLRGAGRLSSPGFKFSGNAAHGITAGNGKISLTRGELAKAGTSVVKDLTAVISLVKAGSGWEAFGRVSQGKGAAGGLVEDLEGRFSAVFSNRMKPLQARMPAVTASIAGIAVQGKVAYRPGESEPVTASLAAERAPVAVLNRFLATGKETFSSGTAAFSLQASGRGVRDFRGKLRGDLKDVQGHSAGKSFGIKEGAVNADFSAAGGKLAAGGSIRCAGALFDGKTVEAAAAFEIRDREVFVADGSVTLDRARLHFASIRGPFPVRVQEGDFVRLPLRLNLSGATVQSGEASIGDLAGDLGVDVITGRGRRWLAGNGGLTVASLAYKGRDAGSLEGRLKFSESGMAARLDGKLMGGRLQGTAELDPFDLRKKARFSLNLVGAQCSALTSVGPARQAIKVNGGLLDASLAGSYSADAGPWYRLEAKGAGIILAGKDDKPLLASGALHTVSEVMRDRLVIREGSIDAGNGAVLRVHGEVARFLSPDREGEVSLSLPTMPLDSLLGTFVTALPPGFRDVTASGTLGGKGTLRLAHSSIMLDGEASLEKAGFEVPVQKIGAADLTGTIPVSLVIAGGTGPEKNQKIIYPQESYPVLLASLRQAAKSAHTLRIGRLRFSGMELGETALGITAGNGLIEITALESKFLEGALLGKGYFRYGENIQYGVELALNSLSLRSLCNAFPNIKGYISGKVDGIMNFYGERKEMNGLIGIVDIWTRSAPDDKMLVSKEFLQKLAGKKLKGIFFQNDRPYDHGKIHGYLEKGYLVFDILDISHTNIFGIKDLSVSVAPVQNKIAIDHLLASIKEAAIRGKAVGSGDETAPARPGPIQTEFKWEE